MDAHTFLRDNIPNRTVLDYSIDTQVDVIDGPPIERDGVLFANRQPGATTYTVTLRLAP